MERYRGWQPSCNTTAFLKENNNNFFFFPLSHLFLQSTPVESPDLNFVSISEEHDAEVRRGAGSRHSQCSGVPHCADSHCLSVPQGNDVLEDEDVSPTQEDGKRPRSLFFPSTFCSVSLAG